MRPKNVLFKINDSKIINSLLYDYFSIKNSPECIERDLIQANMKIAFQLWSEYSGLTFHQIKTKKKLRKYQEKFGAEAAHITIEFLKGKR